METKTILLYSIDDKKKHLLSGGGVKKTRINLWSNDSRLIVLTYKGPSPPPLLPVKNVAYMFCWALPLSPTTFFFFLFFHFASFACPQIAQKKPKAFALHAARSSSLPNTLFTD